jgi:polyhydroxyalkanoate synthesis regulator phasin
MILSRKRVLGSLSIVALLLVIVLALTSTGRPAVSAAPPAVANATPASSAAGTPGPSAADTQQLVNDALARFAARLGVSPQTLNDDFIASVNDTIDQAVRDGKLTQNQGAKIKDQAAQVGLAGVLNGGANKMPGSQSSTSGTKSAQKQDDKFFATAWEAALEQMTTTLGITPDQLKQGLGTQRVADIAQAHNVDLAHLRAAMLAAGQAKLNGFVQAGQMTQAQADNTYASLTQQVDNLLAQSPQNDKQGNRWQDNGPGADALQAAWEAGAAKIGLDPAELKKEMASGKTVAAIAADHGVTVQQLRDTMIAAGRASIDNAVKSGKVPQDQANTLYSELDKQVDQLINTAPASSATPVSR